MRLADSRTFCTAGSSRPTSIPIMAMTTSNSISVKPDLDEHFISGSFVYMKKGLPK